MTEKEASKIINSVSEKPIELSLFLYELASASQRLSESYLKKLFYSYIDHTYPTVKANAYFGLLFAIQDDKKLLKEKAIYEVRNSEDYDVVSSCIQGLGACYQSSLDRELLELFYNIYLHNEDDNIKVTAFISMNKILGLSSAQILAKNNYNIIITLDDLSESLFDVEIIRIKNIISPDCS
jgi:hypothetical protein